MQAIFLNAYFNIIRLALNDVYQLSLKLYEFENPCCCIFCLIVERDHSGQPGYPGLCKGGRGAYLGSGCAVQ